MKTNTDIRHLRALFINKLCLGFLAFVLCFCLGLEPVNASLHPGNQRFIGMVSSSAHFKADKWANSVVNPVAYHAYRYVQGNPVLYRDPWGTYIEYALPAKKRLISLKNLKPILIKEILNIDYKNEELENKFGIDKYKSAMLSVLNDHSVKYTVSVVSNLVMDSILEEAGKDPVIEEALGFSDYETNIIYLNERLLNDLDNFYEIKTLIHEIGHMAIQELAWFTDATEYSFIDDFAIKVKSNIVEQLKNCVY